MKVELVTPYSGGGGGEFFPACTKKKLNGGGGGPSSKPQIVKKVTHAGRNSPVGGVRGEQKRGILNLPPKHKPG